MKVLISVLFIYIAVASNAQNDSTKVFSISLEFRPRAEFRHGYSQLPEIGEKPAFFVSNRTRFNIDYDQKRFRFHTSIQDIRIWGEEGGSFLGMGFGLFEGYVEPFFTDTWSVRIGRQAVELDNGRLFARSDWNQSSKAHEGINVRYTGKKIQSELMGFYNQNGEQIFGTLYTPSESNYLFLMLHSGNYRLSEKFKLYTLNAFDGYQQPLDPNTVYVRGTSGGRLSYSAKKFDATLAGYFQYGDLVGGTPIRAYYFQPEISIEYKKNNVRLGMEYMSGDDLTNELSRSNSFNTLYGVAFRFMGNMNYFTRFPQDTDSHGLVDPYLFWKYTFSNRFAMNIDWHAFFGQQDLTKVPGTGRFLGVEQDLTARYKVNQFITIQGAICLLAPSENMATIQNKVNYSPTIAVYSYFMATFKPELFHHVSIETK